MTDKPNAADETGKPKVASSKVRAKSAKVGDDMEEIYTKYLETLATIQENTTSKYIDLLQKYSGEACKLQTDVVSADPSGAFLSDVMQAYKNNDQKGVAESYAAVNKHVAQTQATAEKRYLDLIKSYLSETEALSKDHNAELIDRGRDYGKNMASAIKKIDFDSLDPTSKSVLAHGLMMSAVTQPASTGKD